MKAPGLSFIHQLVPGEGMPASTPLLLLHGTGGNENDLLDLGRTLLPGATLLSPRGKVLESGMPRFFRRRAEGVFDTEDLQRRTQELADFVRDACEAYSLDTHRMIAVGYSNGANIAASTLLLRPETLAAAVLFRPMVPLVPDALPDLAAKHILIAAGQRDPIANSKETDRLANLLLAAGAAVETHWEEVGHELSNGDVVAARTWISSVWAKASLARANAEFNDADTADLFTAVPRGMSKLLASGFAAQASKTICLTWCMEALTFSELDPNLEKIFYYITGRSRTTWVDSSTWLDPQKPRS